MNANGYVIARNRKVDQFFTSRSSYDRPQWIGVNEATVYPTAEMAQAAWTKLAKRGAYEARVVPISEAITLELPEEDPAQADEQGGEMEVEFGPGDDGQSEMVAADQSDPCDACAHVPCTCDQDTDGVDDIIDQLAIDDIPPDEDPVTKELNSRMSADGAELAQRLPAGRRGMAESATMPAKPPLDAVTPGNKDTVHDVKGAEEIKYNDPANKADKPSTDLTTVTAQPNDDKVTVPAEVMSDLKKCIAEFNKEAEHTNSYNDTRATFCLTVASAFEQLQKDLERGDVEGVKMAQVHLTSYMSPITSNLPQSVLKYIHSGGRKPTLKDLFDTKKETHKLTESAKADERRIKQEELAIEEFMERRQEAEEEGDDAEVRKLDRDITYSRAVIANIKRSHKQVSEATNHMGERTQSTYSGWKRACQQAHPGCTFRGDRDIGAAVLNGRDVGEWDGAEGSVFAKKEA